MAHLTVPTISTERLTWTATTKTFAAEASDLGSDFRPSRLYDDACDVGIAVRSHWTGTVLRWFLFREIRDAENELQGWEFKPTPEALKKYPRYRDYQMVIFND